MHRRAARRSASASRCCRTTATGSRRSSTATCWRCSCSTASRATSCSWCARRRRPRCSTTTSRSSPRSGARRPARASTCSRCPTRATGRSPRSSSTGPTSSTSCGRLIAGRPAFIEPWNVTDHEVAVALALDVPINGSAPRLWPLGFKSAGRRLFKEAGVPVAAGCEDVRTIDDVLGRRRVAAGGAAPRRRRGDQARRQRRRRRQPGDRPAHARRPARHARGAARVVPPTTSPTAASSRS